MDLTARSRQRVPMGDDKRKTEIDRQIDENLKRVYQTTLEQDVPDKFKNLLEQLRKQGEGEKG